MGNPPFHLALKGRSGTLFDSGTFSIGMDSSTEATFFPDLSCGTDRCTGAMVFPDGPELPFEVRKTDERSWILVLGPAEKTTRMAFSHSLHGGEKILGLGENFDSLLNNGKRRPMQIELSDSESGNNEAHVPIPFYLSSRGYAVWVENAERGYVDVGRTQPDRVETEFHTRQLVVHLYAHPDPLVLIRDYTRDTGRPPFPPPWAFGVHFWRNEYDASPVGKAQSDAMTDAETIRSLDFPASVFWIDAPYETGHNSFEFDTAGRFPDPAGLIRFLNDKGFRVIAWITQHINDPELADEPAMKPLYDEAVEKGFLVKTPGGAPFISPWSRGPGAMVDFTNPDAVRWYQALARKFLDLGIQGWKLDFGEEIIPALLGQDVGRLYIFFNGLDANAMHARYKFLYHQTFRDVTQEKHGDDWFAISRTGMYGSQSLYSCIWPGDIANDFSKHTVGIESPGHIGGLPAAILGGINLGVVGFPFYGSDVGGYRGGSPDDEVFIRWAQFGALSPVMQIGGNGEHRPWADKFPENTLRIIQDYARLHISLFPYIYSHAERAHQEGIPIMKALPLVFPSDARAYGEEFEYLFGDSILVAPVIEASDRRDIYLPEGRWIDFWTDALHAGPVTLDDYPAPIERIPLFVRLPAIIPMLPEDVDTLARTNDPMITTIESAEKPWRIHIYPLPGTAMEFAVPGYGTISLDTRTGTEVEVDQFRVSELKIILHTAGLP